MPEPKVCKEGKKKERRERKKIDTLKKKKNKGQERKKLFGINTVAGRGKASKEMCREKEIFLIYK